MPRMSCPLISNRRVLVAMSSGKVLPTNMEISPTNRGICIEQRSCKVRLGEFSATCSIAVELGSSSRLVRYAAGIGPCFSSRPDAPSASREHARRSCHPGSNFGSPVWPTKPRCDARLRALRQSGFEAIALALSVPIIGKKKFLAVQALASGFRRLHRVPNQQEPVSETARTGGRKSTRKKTHTGEEGRRFFSECLEENASEEDPVPDR